MIIHLQVRDAAGRPSETSRVDWGDGVPPSAGETLTIGPLKVAIAEYKEERHTPVLRGDGSINMGARYTCWAEITRTEAAALLEWAKMLPKEFGSKGMTVPAWPGGRSGSRLGWSITRQPHRHVNRANCRTYS